MNKLLLAGAFLLLGTVVLVGCHPTKKTAGGKAKTEKTSSRKKKKAKADTAMAVVPLSPATASDAVSQRLDVLSGVNATFQTFSGKAKAKLTRGDESNEFTANIRIRHGQAIWINISLGGIWNVARVYITPDSVRMLNFLQKSAKLLPFSEAGKLLPFPVSFSDLEALLLGYAPAPSAGSSTLILANNGSLELQTTNTNGTAQRIYFALPDTAFRRYEIGSISGAAQAFSLRMAVENPTGDVEHLFYKNRAASWETPAGNGSLMLDFDAPQWDGEVSMPFSVPKNYERN